MAATRASHTASLLTALLSVCQFWWAGSDDSTTSAGLGALSLLSALALVRTNRVETRLLVVTAVTAQLVVTTLMLAVGLPGQERQPLDVPSTIALLLVSAVLVSIDLDRRTRRARRSATEGGGSPYAR